MARWRPSKRSRKSKKSGKSNANASRKATKATKKAVQSLEGRLAALEREHRALGKRLKKLTKRVDRPAPGP